MENQHSAYIDKRICDLRKKNKWNTKIMGSHEDIIKDFSGNVFTNLICNTFTVSYLAKHPCSDCKKPSKERCHGIGEERPLLLKKALQRVYPDTTLSVTLKEILIAFLEEHKMTKFTFKCSDCHKAETSSKPNQSIEEQPL